MAETKSIIRPAVSLFCVVVTALGLYNVYGDNAEVRARAEALACGKKDCAVRITSQSRSPIGQQFEFQTEGSTRVTVDCRRAAWLLGGYQCEREGGPAPALSSSARPASR